MAGYSDIDAAELFGSYMKLVGVPSLEDEACGEPGLKGKKLGLINGSTWIQLWSYYFGRKYLPGAKLVNVGSEAVQINFMQAHKDGKACPPQRNIDLFAQYAKDLVELSGVDAIMITCSTMNRSVGAVEKALEGYNVPVIQIDEPMMQAAVKKGGRILIVATHGPTVDNTKKLLIETASEMGVSELSFEQATVESAFEHLGKGDVKKHNEIIAQSIRDTMKRCNIDSVVLAQLSMSVFKLTYPNAEETFGIPVFTSGEEGFKRSGEILRGAILEK